MLSWIHSLLAELGVTTSKAPLIFCDNLSSTYLTHNPLYHNCMKYISIDIHFVKDLVEQGKFKVHHVCTTNQLADCFTKPLSKAFHQQLKNKITFVDGTPIF
uniref:Copia protein n=1 Tax=Cajanus cajan TaxID=3821 RepID=A0A151RKK9_CAJCA|nr:Copia protein [Cajanus cajan]